MNFKFIIILLFIIKSFAGHTAVHVIGDSHSEAFRKIDGCTVHWIGPITMHRIGRDGLSFLNEKNLGINENDIVVFVFGEIDVRCHIGKQRDTKQRDLDEIIQTLVYDYINAIINYRGLYQNLKCIVYSPIPPTDQVMNDSFPRWGRLEDRIFITKELNNLLREVCVLNNIFIIDVYADYADSSGALITDLSDGSVHIHSTHSGCIKDKLYEILDLF